MGKGSLRRKAGIYGVLVKLDCENILGDASASTYTVDTLIPRLNADSFASVSSVMFALAGAEISANFVTEVEDVKKTFSRATIIAAALVGGLYVLGSVAITMVLSPEKITASQGILEALSVVAVSLGIGLWFIKIVAFGISLSVIGTIIINIASPVRMLFGSVQKGIFSE